MNQRKLSRFFQNSRSESGSPKDYQNSRSESDSPKDYQKHITLEYNKVDSRQLCWLYNLDNHSMSPPVLFSALYAALEESIPIPPLIDIILQYWVLIEENQPPNDEEQYEFIVTLVVDVRIPFEMSYDFRERVVKVQDEVYKREYEYDYVYAKDLCLDMSALRSDDILNTSQSSVIASSIYETSNQVITILSCNINGLEHAIKTHWFYTVLKSCQVDFLCLQETRTSSYKSIPNVDAHIYQSVANLSRPIAARKYSRLPQGYSGVMVVTRHKALQWWDCFLSVSVSSDDKSDKKSSDEIEPTQITSIFESQPVPTAQPPKFSITEHRDIDHQGRIVTLEYPAFFLVNVYAPHPKSQMKYRLELWELWLLAHVFGLQKLKPVIAVGDWNVIHTKYDTLAPHKTKNMALSDPQLVEWMTRHIKVCDLIDTFRVCRPREHVSTYASPNGKDLCMRIDYQLASSSLVKDLVNADVTRYRASDHFATRSVWTSRALRMESKPLKCIEIFKVCASNQKV